jgi:uncharacterized MAPEG superfamily protein
VLGTTGCISYGNSQNCFIDSLSLFHHCNQFNYFVNLIDLSSTDYSYLFLVIAGFLPFIFTGVAKYGTYSRNANRDPRAFRNSLTGARKRAYAAQDNSFESFPFFACGVIVAHLWGEPSHFLWLNSLAALHIATRLLYGWAYIADRDLLRSVFWSIGFIAALALYLV